MDLLRFRSDVDADVLGEAARRVRMVDRPVSRASVAVQAFCSIFGIALSLGTDAVSATLRVTSPRRSAWSRAPRMIRCTS